MLISVKEVFQEHGPLSQAVPDFQPRAQQLEMAQAVEAAVAGLEVLVCEAGTGTGKTFAYLAPVLLSGERCIISTGTRHLQDQLYNRDLPLVEKALGVQVSHALLKGRANYLCLERLERARGETADFFRGESKELKAVNDWAPRTITGDIAGCSTVPEDSTIWPKLTSTADTCAGRECSFYDQCHVMEARKRAATADVVVVNHHLLLADMNLREEGFAEVLPNASAIVFDEAHQLPDLAARFFGQSISSRQLSDFSRDLSTIYREEAAGESLILNSGVELERMSADLKQALGEPGERIDFAGVRQRDEVNALLLSMSELMGDLAPTLESLGEDAQKAQLALRRSYAFRERMEAFVNSDDTQAVRWLEMGSRGFALHRTPIDVAEPFQARISAYDAAQIYTSATLAVGGHFDYFTERLGLRPSQSHCWESPFDFENQSRMYLPGLREQPNSPNYTEAVCEAALPILAASGGRAFMLFTSHRALREAGEYLRAKTDWILFMQGEAPRAVLIDRFRQSDGAVLLGTTSFWEGVDVRGEALSLVVIDKLPFQAPNDPVLRARVRRLEERGGNAFRELQVPEAVIMLKQGVGRLLRDEKDSGVVMLCDPRLRGKSYGKTFLKSIPPMPATDSIQEIQRFYRRR